MAARMSPFRLMLYTAAVLVVLAMAYLFLQVGSVLVIVILGVILAAAIEPIVYRLRRHGLGRGQAILSVYAVMLLTIGLGIYLILPSVVRQGGALIESIPATLNTLQDQTEASDNRFIRESGTAAVQRIQRFYVDFQESPPIAGATAVQLVSSTVGVLFTVITTLIVGFYWMTEKPIIKRLLLGLLAPRYRDRVHGIWDNVEAKLGGWTRGQAVLCLAIGLASAVAYSPLVLDLPFWVALALWSGITELIPFIGPWLGGSAAAVVALTQSFETAIYVVIFVIVLQQIEGAWLVPKVMKNAVGLTPLTVVIAVQVGNAIGGPVGAILAIPIAAAVQVVIQDLLASRKETIDFGIRRSRPDLRLLAMQRSPNDARFDATGISPPGGDGAGQDGIQQRVSHRRTLRKVGRRLDELDGRRTPPAPAGGRSAPPRPDGRRQPQVDQPSERRSDREDSGGRTVRRPQESPAG